MRVADNLLMLALAGPKDSWSAQLEYALTAGCLMDLASEGRIEADETGGLQVLNPTPTGRPPHDLVLGRIAEIDSERLPSTWVSRLAPETSTALLVDACARGVVTERTRRILGIWPRPEYDVTDQARIVELREEMLRVYKGSSTDPLATALFGLCAAAGLPKLMPGRLRQKALRRRAQQLPPSAVSDGLGHAAAALAVPLFTDTGAFMSVGLGDFGGGGDGS